MFLFYYSGHSDQEALHLGSSRFPLDRLRQAFQAVPSQIKIGVFDACQSGMLTRFKGGRTSKAFRLDELKNVQGQVIISSSAMDERSQESDELEGSVFTHHWLNGLRGSADISGDRKVTLNEAYEYAHRMTVETTAKTRAGIQHPAYLFRIHGEGDIVLADLTQGRSGLGFGFRVDGKYLIVDRDRGHILADFYKTSDREMLISLPRGAYRVFKVEKDSWRVADAEVAEDKVTEFKPATLKEQPQIVNQLKGSLAGKYTIIPGPPREALFPGASRRWGLGFNLGEGAGFVSLALLCNLDAELQLSAGLGLSTGESVFLETISLDDSSAVPTADSWTNSYFLSVRQYRGPYFVQAGLNYYGTKAAISDTSGTNYRHGWELGLPLLFGFEIGPRQSMFASLSIGYVWMLTGGGHMLSGNTPGGRLEYAHTADSGPVLGFRLGWYLF
jgi:hypothetical protein